MFKINNEVEIVTNTATAINATLSARNAAGWALALLVDKPASTQVYLVFSKVVDEPA